MLTEEQIENNKQRFIELLRRVTREGADIESLISWLEDRSDFFVAPASTKYHQAYKGGLCEHSLEVCDTIFTLAHDFKRLPADEENGTEERIVYSDDTLLIVSLLHDISKANFYEEYTKNVNSGQKDERGKTIWIQQLEYKTRDAENRFIYGNHEETSEYMARTFIPLTLEESVAILHHHGGQGFDSTQMDVSIIFKRHNLSLLLHVADMLSTFLTHEVL